MAGIQPSRSDAGCAPEALAGEPPALADRSIVMIGLMGAGKTSVGRRLAQRLHLAFTDADEEIVRAAGCSVSEIFARFGEAAFREGERKVITRLLQEPPRVLATGGGAFLDGEIRDHIRRHGLSVWLRADLDVLVRRTEGRSHRPLLNTGDPRATLARLMAQRYPVYAAADVIVDSDDGPIDRMVDRVLAAVLPHLRPPAPSLSPQPGDGR
jgi:shikimate kinase